MDREHVVGVKRYTLSLRFRCASVLNCKPRVNRTHFHGVFAPNSKLRSWLTLSGRGKRLPQAPIPAELHEVMNWAQRLKRVFQLDLSQCEYGGKVKIIASIEDEATIYRQEC